MIISLPSACIPCFVSSNQPCLQNLSLTTVSGLGCKAEDPGLNLKLQRGSDYGEISYGPIQWMFNGSGEVGVEGADCAVSVGWAVKWDRGGSQPAYCRMGRAEKTEGEGGVFRESTLNSTEQPWCLLAGNKCCTENPSNEVCIIQYLLWLEPHVSHTVLPGKMKAIYPLTPQTVPFAWRCLCPCV